MLTLVPRNPGPLTERIQSIRPSLRPWRRAALFCTLHTREFKKGNLFIKIIGEPKLHRLSETSLAYEVYLEAFYGKKRIKLDNPFQFVNPTIAVNDNTFFIETDGNIYSNLKDDLESAFYAMIVEAVEGQWQH